MRAGEIVDCMCKYVSMWTESHKVSILNGALINRSSHSVLVLTDYG